MDSVDRAIINTLQHGFPITDEPFSEVAHTLNINEVDLMTRIRSLLDENILTRFGPMYHAERMGGALSLVAMSVPEDQYELVTRQVNSFPEVAHNYRREHELNMWFVLATERPDDVDTTLQAIEQKTGLKTYNMPKEQEFYVGLHFKV